MRRGICCFLPLMRQKWRCSTAKTKTTGVSTKCVFAFDSPPPFQNFYRLFESTLDGRNVHLLSIEGALRFGKSVRTVQTLLDFSLSYADGAIAPASNLVPLLAAARSRSRSDTTPWCHSSRSRRFATQIAPQSSFTAVVFPNFALCILHF